MTEKDYFSKLPISLKEMIDDAIWQVQGSFEGICADKFRHHYGRFILETDLIQYHFNDQDMVNDFIWYKNGWEDGIQASGTQSTDNADKQG